MKTDISDVPQIQSKYPIASLLMHDTDSLLYLNLLEGKYT